MTEMLIPFEPKKKKDVVNGTLRPTNVDRKIYATFVNNCKLNGLNLRKELEQCIHEYNIRNKNTKQ
jgi:hypothetical protein